MKRIEPQQIDALLAASNTLPSTSQGSTVSETSNVKPEPGALAQDSTKPLESEALAETCTIDDFSKVDLRVARVVDAEEVPEARKLLKLTVSLGGDDRRTIFAGIKKFHRPEDLHGRLVVIVANLAPRQMKFGLSEGMVVAASGAGADGVYLLSPDSGALPGMRLG
jgi:methionyl-tRNA synthetase